MFSDFPSLHPLIVHFPVVLVLLAVAFQAAVTWKDWQQIRWATLFIMAGAFLSAWAASTVFHAMPSEDAPKEAMEIFLQHEKFAQYTLWMSGFTLLLKCIGDFYKLNRRSYDSLVLSSAIVTAIFLSVTGHHGARLTHVAGVGPMGRYLMKDHDEKNMDNMKEMKGDKPMPGMDTTNDMKDMNNKSDMKKMDMKDMNMKKMDNKKDMKNMDMKDMDNNKDMKDMNMNNMDNEKDMKGVNMKDMDNMKDMNMTGKNPMDTFRFEDNNPAWQNKKK